MTAKHGSPGKIRAKAKVTKVIPKSTGNTKIKRRIKNWDIIVKKIQNLFRALKTLVQDLQGT
jgi:hypothetical protein